MFIFEILEILVIDGWKIITCRNCNIMLDVMFLLCQILPLLHSDTIMQYINFSISIVQDKFIYNRNVPKRKY
jgi:hypothetical protein